MPELPAGPCGLTIEEYDALRTKVDQMSADIADIKSAVIGHEQYGHRGLIARMSIVERCLFVLALIAVALGGERMIKFLF
jgi:hypothetical protein